MKKITAGAMLFLMSSAIADKETDARLDKLMGPATHQQYHQFLENLQHAVAIADKRSVAAMIDYPVTVSVNGRPVSLANEQDFITNFDFIFNEKLKKTVAEQKYENLFAKDSGIMVGSHGEIWFSGICITSDCQKFAIKIIAINN